MKTRLFVVYGPNPLQRQQVIEQVLAGCGQDEKITLMASSEVFSRSTVAEQAALFRTDEARKARGVHLLRLAPGCLCCTSKLIMTTHLTRTMRLNQPDTLVLELESQSHPQEVLALLKAPQWQDWFADIQLVGDGPREEKNAT